MLLQRLETEGNKLCSHDRQAEPCLNRDKISWKEGASPALGSPFPPSPPGGQELVGSKTPLPSTGASELLLSRADVRLPGLPVHGPGTAFPLQLANLCSSGPTLDHQLGTGPGPVCAGWGLCFLLLGLPQAPGHPYLSPWLCLPAHTPVSPGQRTGGIVNLGGPGVLGLPLSTNSLQLPHGVTSLRSPHPDPGADSPCHPGIH